MKENRKACVPGDDLWKEYTSELKQLRTEKEQLRTKEEQLRDEAKEIRAALRHQSGTFVKHRATATPGAPSNRNYADCVPDVCLH